MGDPLSAVASVLTLLSAGSAVGKYLKKVVALKRAPDILLALNNDIADLHQLVHSIDELLQKHSQMTDKPPLGHICESLERVKKTLTEFEHLVSYKLTTVERDGKHLRLDRSACLQAEAEIRRIKERIRADKGDLCLSVALLTNSNTQMLQTSVTELEDQVRQIAGTIFNRLEATEDCLKASSEEQRQHGRTLHQIRESLNHHEAGCTLGNRVLAVEVLLGENSDRPRTEVQSLQNVERNVIQDRDTDEELYHQPRAIEAGRSQAPDHCRSQNGPLSGPEEPRHCSNLSPTSASSRHSWEEPEGCTASHAFENPKITLGLLRDKSFSYTTPIKLTRNFCDSACQCVCHQRSQFKSPRSLNAMLGSLFVGYQASPWSAQTCNNSDCRCLSKKLTYVYAFPQWFLARILVFNMAYTQSKGPELCLRVMRVRDIRTLVRLFEYAPRCEGTSESVHHLKRLLSDGEISVLDVSTDGTTILHHALLFLDFRAAEFLIRCGADLYYRNIRGMSAFVEAYEFFLVNPSPVEGETFLQEILWDQPQLDLLGLSELQKAYFGMTGVTYHTALSAMPRSAIDQVDGIGRTILSWASERSDDTTVAELLACGADPNITDSCGLNSLHYAVLGSSEECVRLIFASKVELEATHWWGRTPLAYAAWRSLGICKILLDFGADMEAQSNDGWRPMHYAVWQDSPQMTGHLLHAGADMFSQTSSGNTAIHIAVWYNAHSTLKVLLEARELVARQRDDVWPDVGFEDESSADAVEIAEWRRDCNQWWSEKTLRSCDPDPLAWFHSFESLLKAVESSQSRIFEDSDDEGYPELDKDEGEESSDVGNVDETEDQEVWEDAHES